MNPFLATLGAFVCGSLPTGFLLGKLRGVDLRDHGSGNIGATNAGRILGKRTGALTFAGDFLKGFLAVLIFSPQQDLIMPPLLTLCAVLGHCYSPFLRFRGGKGVATGFGGFLAVSPFPALGAVVGFACLARLTRYVSLASLTAAALFPLLLVWWEGIPALGRLYAVLATSAVVFWRHRTNVRRLFSHTERKLGAREA